VRDFTRIFASHPDHLAAGEATMCAVYPDARNPFTFTELLDEGFEAHTTWQTWIMGGPNPNRYVDTTAQFDRKVAALLCHESQHQNPQGMRDRVRGWNEQIAKAAGFPEGHTAEAFLVIETG
jgi:LmbE family N-acetylglucosaminyl deacetylase